MEVKLLNLVNCSYCIIVTFPADGQVLIRSTSSLQLPVPICRLISFFSFFNAVLGGDAFSNINTVIMEKLKMSACQLHYSALGLMSVSLRRLSISNEVANHPIRQNQHCEPVEEGGEGGADGTARQQAQQAGRSEGRQGMLLTSFRASTPPNSLLSSFFPSICFFFADFSASHRPRRARRSLSLTPERRPHVLSQICGRTPDRHVMKYSKAPTEEEEAPSSTYGCSVRAAAGKRGC